MNNKKELIILSRNHSKQEEKTKMNNNDFIKLDAKKLSLAVACIVCIIFYVLCIPKFLGEIFSTNNIAYKFGKFIGNGLFLGGIIFIATFLISWFNTHFTIKFYKYFIKKNSNEEKSESTNINNNLINLNARTLALSMSLVSAIDLGVFTFTLIILGIFSVLTNYVRLTINIAPLTTTMPISILILCIILAVILLLVLGFLTTWFMLGITFKIYNRQTKLHSDIEQKQESNVSDNLKARRLAYACGIANIPFFLIGFLYGIIFSTVSLNSFSSLILFIVVSSLLMGFIFLFLFLFNWITLAGLFRIYNYLIKREKNK